MMKPKLKILDVSASIGCNLSCKGCNHFSNYFAAGSKISTDALLDDLNKILPRIDTVSYTHLTLPTILLV